MLQYPWLWEGRRAACAIDVEGHKRRLSSSLLGFRVQGLGFRVLDYGLYDYGLGFRVQVLMDRMELEAGPYKIIVFLFKRSFVGFHPNATLNFRD